YSNEVDRSNISCIVDTHGFML
ncbi:hypothetical protein BMETH_3660168232, partial [methanotrophic bacterial endosymbiont of Bathymodiolus sp.]